MRNRLSLLALLALLLTACTGGEESESADPAELSERLSAARTVIDEAESLELALSTEELPQGVTGLLTAEGRGNHDPAFEGDVTVVAGGTSLDAEVVAVDGELYAKTGFAPTFLSLDPSTLGAPDPATLLDPEDGVSTILEDTEDVTEDGESRDGDDVLTTIAGTLPGEAIASIIPTADTEATFTVRYRLTDDDVLRDASIAGPFYPGGRDVTYRLALTTSDEPVEIEAPAGVGGS
ncbi:LppX_LprAFG lipoprotein [Aeromicrobium sp. CF4.19]|uniref:LppX_LprAFG lipoprotein n=1 Tax=Aeromicrobium sp. CF4.19 TaxID=3373082 RepID=UPI003EE7C31B